ncbi:hypothetical protein BT69DRAFT_1348752 [Atractiella rhizophila]|nr:hypothetical protein BT69DRAFT_1348752 [Atractiella rhizophila]
MLTLLAFTLLAHEAQAHVAPWGSGMFCKNGIAGEDSNNANSIVSPIEPINQLEFSTWWMHHLNGCDEYPPPEGEYLEIPANGSFTVEMAVNRAFTTLSYGGSNAGEYVNGKTDPSTWKRSDEGCIVDPNIHTFNESFVAGTAFAISYHSDLKDVTPENLVVFTTINNTPFRRLVTYEVPDLPACPPDGCICAWGWIPDGCGNPNMYQTPWRCKVTGATSTKKLAVAKPPVWCEDEPDKCVTGSKQMLYWHMKTGNNIEVDGFQLNGRNKSPAYNTKCGFTEGAQHDIFESVTNTSRPSSHRVVKVHKNHSK